MYRTAVVPVRLEGADRRRAFEVTHRAGLLYTALIAQNNEFYAANGRAPSQGEALGSVTDPDVLRMHAHTKIGVYTRLMENIGTALSNMSGDKVEGARLPWRAKQYMPVTFTAGYGWRITPAGRLSLSLGRADGRLLLPVPSVVDARTGQPVPCDAWGEIELCWDRDNRRWALHISYPTEWAVPVLDPAIVVGVDEGIINPMTLAVKTDDGYAVTVINGRAARAVKHRRNTSVAKVVRAKSRCRKGSRRWKKLDRAERRAKGKATTALRNIDHQVTRKAAKFVQAAGAGTITVGDVRGIEKNTRHTERKRAGRHQRRRLSQWSRGRQERYLGEKTSVALTHVDESYSSRTCPACLTRNHPTGRNYQCRACGFTCHRDAVGAINILNRATYGSYTRIDPTTRVRVTYLRATPLPQHSEAALSTAQMRATTATTGRVSQESEVPYPDQAAA